MSTLKKSRIRSIQRLMGAGILAVLLTASAGAADDRKLDRQIELFERIVDDMLVESPNWLVQGRHETRGRYRSGDGARFTFDADLVNRGWGRSHRWWKDWSWGWDHDDDDDVIIIDVDDLDDLDTDELRDLKKSREKSRDRHLRREARLYERGKAEMVDVFLDYGDLLSQLPDGETLEIVAYLEDAEYFYENDLRTLSMSAKMSDVRAWADGKIDKKAMVERITVTEE